MKESRRIVQTHNSSLPRRVDMVSDLLVFLFEVVDAFLLVSDGFLSLANLFLVPLSKKIRTINKPADAISAELDLTPWHGIAWH